MSDDSNVVVVMLRRPFKHKSDEMRSDPFWEFGSFGCTRCHERNLLNPKRLNELNGVRLAFMQGGKGEIRLVYLTPPVQIVHHLHGSELRWSPAGMPFRFEKAPLAIDNFGNTELPAVREAIAATQRGTPVAKFASRFRSRRRPVSKEFANQIEETYRMHKSVGGTIAKHYADAIPDPLPRRDDTRKKTYRSLIAKLNDRHPARLSDRCRPHVPKC